MALVPFVACLGGIPTPIIRAMMSKMVDPDEQGNETGFSSIDIYCSFGLLLVPKAKNGLLVVLEELRDNMKSLGYGFYYSFAISLSW